MTTLVVLLVVGAVSVAYRVVPLLGAARVPEAVSRTAGWAGVSVMTAVVVQRVLEHRDPSTPWAVPVAAASVALALWVAARRRSTLLVLGVGVAGYVALSLLARALVAA